MYTYMGFGKLPFKVYAGILVLSCPNTTDSKSDISSNGLPPTPEPIVATEAGI
jgi:hypothetical protein